MKKILLIVASFVWFIPITLAAEECSNEAVSELKNQIKNIDYVFEYMPEGTKVDFQTRNDGVINIDVSNKIKFSFNNLSSDFYVHLVNGDNYNTIYGTDPIYFVGGVYKVEFYNIYCSNIINSYEIMIPFYDKNKKEVFDDGTYSAQNNNKNDNKNKKTFTISNIILILIIIFLFACIVVGFIFIKKKRVSKK